METIHFHCPACRKPLKLPATAAGQRGPCPNCGEDIIGPQPDLGIPARTSLPSAPPLQEIPLPAVPAEDPAPFRDPVSPKDPVAEALEPFRPKPAASTPEPAASAVAPPDEPDPPHPPVAETPTVPAVVEEPTRRIRRLWTAVFILSCLLCTVLSFIGGYLTALQRFEVDAPIFTLAPKSPESTTPPPLEPLLEPIPEPLPPIDPDPTPEEATENTDPDSRTTLDAFLSAPDWAARSAYVLHADSVRPLMKEAAADRDGPIDVTSVEPSLLDDDLHHYRVKTPDMPEGFPATLRKGPDGWLVDWITFHEFSSDRFGRFIRGESEDQQTLRLLIKQAEDPQSAFSAYHIASPAGAGSATAYAARSGRPHARLVAFFDSDQIRDNPQYRKLLEGNGLPVVATLERKQTRGGDAYFEIVELLSFGWNPDPGP